MQTTKIKIKKFFNTQLIRQIEQSLNIEIEELDDVSNNFKDPSEFGIIIDEQKEKKHIGKI